jgi:hypothetical protein
MSEPLVIEGIWEEILARSSELTGRRVRVMLMPDRSDKAPKQAPLSPDNQRLLQLLDEWERDPLTDEERAVLDGLEEHLADHPIRL